MYTHVHFKNVSSNHFAVVRLIHLSSDHVSRSHEEIAVWKEREVQVAKEEMRIKAALSQIKKPSVSSKTSREKELQAKVGGCYGYH